jgi:flagellar protein FliO/FliZ
MMRGRSPLNFIGHLFGARASRSDSGAGHRSARHPAFIAARMAILLAAFSATAFAADEDKVFTPGASKSETPVKTVGGSLSSMSLILGVGLAAAGGWLVWRNRRGTPIGRDMRALAVDETRSLGNRQYLVVASYEGKKFLLGVCPGRIEMLSALDGSGVKEKSFE